MVLVFSNQSEFAVRHEWGATGLNALAPLPDVLIIVVLSFSTAVDIAVSRGAIIFPYPQKGTLAAEYARSVEANLACSDRSSGFSLSPASLRDVPSGFRLVLPSPNGGALCFLANHSRVLTACLRNAAAVASAATRLGTTISLISAGEIWEDGTLRPSLEDLLGAGAVISELSGIRSPEADVAAAAFEHFRSRLRDSLRTGSSGKELIERGFALDVDLAAELNVSATVPRLIDGAFQGVS